MRILAVTSWGGACGIANYAEMLRDHLPADIEFVPCSEALDPLACQQDADIIWLNYHRGLHSRWTPSCVQALNKPCVITFHDTYGEAPPDALTVALHDLADAFIVHEPCEGLPKQILIRQGVLGWQEAWQFDERRPLLGTCGFNFPWKNFDRLCQVTAEAGWAIYIQSNNATAEDEARWRALNPHLHTDRAYLTGPQIVSRLAGCDATAFPYECANSGTSGAIRLGIAARKPVLAFSGCRQFRDLKDDFKPPQIRWCTDFDDLQFRLQRVPIQRCDPGVVYLAERDSWVRHGQRYADVFKSVLA